MKAIKFSIPKSWDELSDGQLEKIAALLHSGRKGPAFDITIFMILVNLRWYTWLKNYRVFKVLQDVPLSELKHHYWFIYKKDDRTIFPKSLLSPWQRLLFWKWLKTPGARLSTLTAAEFASSESMSKLWEKEKHRNPLQYMAATIYRRSGHVFLQPVFEATMLPKLAKRFDNVPLQKLLAMELAYNGSKNALIKRFPVAFPKNGSRPAGGKLYGFGKAVLNMSGGKFGTHTETGQTNIYTFLEEFEENINAANK